MLILADYLEERGDITGAGIIRSLIASGNPSLIWFASSIGLGYVPDKNCCDWEESYCDRDPNSEARMEFGSDIAIFGNPIPYYGYGSEDGFGYIGEFINTFPYPNMGYHIFSTGEDTANQLW